MLPTLGNRVGETSITTGSGSMTLGGVADPRYQTFVAGVGAGKLTYYAIVHRTLNEWEVGTGTVSAGPDTLVRATIIANHLGTFAPVSFSAGTKDVFADVPAEALVQLRRHGEADRRGTFWENAHALGLEYKTQVDQTVQLPLSMIDFHGLIMVDDRIFGGSLPFTSTALPAQFIRFNDLDDLTNYTAVTLPYVSGSNNIGQICYARTTKKIYGFSGPRFYVLDPETMVATLTTLGTTVTGQGGNFDTAQTIATDETYLYVANYTFNTGTILYRFLLSNLSLAATTLSLPNNSQAHHLTVGGTKLYVNGRETTLNASQYYAWVARVDLASFTLEQTAQLGTHLISTKSMAIVGDYLWMGLETIGQAMRVRATDLTQQTVIATGCSGTFAGIYYDGRHVWMGTNSGTPLLLRIEPFTLEVTWFTLTSAFVADILGDGSRLFIQSLPNLLVQGPVMSRLTAPMPTGNGGWSGEGACPSLAWGPKGMGHGTFNPQYGLHSMGGGARIQGMATPGAPNFTLTGTPGSTTYGPYVIIAKDSQGNRSLAGTAASFTTGPAALSNSTFLDIKWSLVEGACSYDVLKNGLLLGNTQTTRWVDSGQTGSAYTLPTRNESADMRVDGFLNRPIFTPANTADPIGQTNDECGDDGFVYRKTSTGWKRAALSTF